MTSRFTEEEIREAQQYYLKICDGIRAMPGLQDVVAVQETHKEQVTDPRDEVINLRMTLPTDIIFKDKSGKVYTNNEITNLISKQEKVVNSYSQAINLAIADLKKIDKHLFQCDFKIEENSTREIVKFAIKNLDKALTAADQILKGG